MEIQENTKSKNERKIPDHDSRGLMYKQLWTYDRFNSAGYFVG